MAKDPAPLIMVGPPPGRGWGDLTDAEIKSIARAAARQFMAKLNDGRSREDSPG